jgi:putative transcriptional regulator
MKNTMKVQRAIKNITQDELAEALGISRQTVNAVELNKYTPTLLLGMRMARFFGVPVDELFTLEEEDY